MKEIFFSCLHIGSQALSSHKQNDRGCKRVRAKMWDSCKNSSKAINALSLRLLRFFFSLIYRATRISSNWCLFLDKWEARKFFLSFFLSLLLILEQTNISLIVWYFFNGTFFKSHEVKWRQPSLLCFVVVCDVERDLFWTQTFVTWRRWFSSQIKRPSKEVCDTSKQWDYDFCPKKLLVFFLSENNKSLNELFAIQWLTSNCTRARKYFQAAFPFAFYKLGKTFCGRWDFLRGHFNTSKGREINEIELPEVK